MEEAIELIETKKPVVKLFTATANPLEAIALAIDIWHHPVGEINYNLSEEELVEKFRWLLKQPHQTPFEYVSLVWTLENVSRAFQQQLTRHRVGFSYSIQSLRVIDVESFASEGRYHIPNTVENKHNYQDAMLGAQADYNEMVAMGESIEDARGILPLNIHSPITMSCTYRSLIGLLRQRLCVAAQEEWVAVAEQMRNELAKIHPVLVEPLDCMCKRFTNGKGVCKTTHEKVTV